MKSSAIILCGGLGTRLRSAVSDRPKCMALVKGRPFLEYQLKWLKSKGIKRVILAVGFKSEQVVQHFGNGSSHDLTIEYSLEQEPKGTGGATLKAMETYGLEHCLVMNGDSFIDIDIQGLEDFFSFKQAEVCMTCHSVDKADRFGVVEFDAQNRLVAFSEKKQQGSAAWINSGIYMLSRSIFYGFSSDEKFSLEDDILNKRSAQGRYVFQCIGKPFIDIGTPESYQTAMHFFRDMKIMGNGLTEE